MEPDATPVGEVPLGLSAHLGPPRRSAAIGRRTWWRRHGSTLSTVVGLAAAVAGVALSTARADPSVHLDAAGYHVGTATLPEVRAGAFAAGAVVLLARLPTGAVEAAGSVGAGGAHVVGRCSMVGAAERCRFRIGGGAALTADDTLVSAGGRTWWQRRYSDGSTTRIDIADGAPVPVPLLLGR